MKFLIAVMLLISSNTLLAQLTADEKAIDVMLSAETEAYNTRPIHEVWLNYWLLDEQTLLNCTMVDGTLLHLNKESMLELPNIVTGDAAAKLTRSKYKFRIVGDRAWVSFETDIETPQEGVKIRAYDLRIIKKIDGQWRNHIVSIHHKLIN